jgi:hypothetical protein
MTIAEGWIFMSLLDELPKWFETKPLILLRLPDRVAEGLLRSRNSSKRFTFAEPHSEFNELKLPTLCLAEMPSGYMPTCYVGVIKSKAAVTTVESRLSIIKLKALNLPSLNSLEDKLAKKTFKTALKQKLATSNVALRLSHKLSIEIIDALVAETSNRKAIESVVSDLPKLRRTPMVQWEQSDAVNTAITAFGLRKDDLPESVVVPEGSDSSLSFLVSDSAHALEDNVIGKDASIIPEFTLIEKHVTGRAVFRNHRTGERLLVYTANKGPLESMLGVDLIYVNETLGNTVMVQYKMLEMHTEPDSTKTDWIFRQDDQLQDEMDRMKLPPVAGQPDDYRLHRNPFFFKFVRREGDGELHRSFIISLDHLNHFLASLKGKGPKGGVRVSYEALAGAYLREADLIGLIRSGYIGTHRFESRGLNPIISEVSKGNRALVLAWQKRIHRGGKS